MCLSCDCARLRLWLRIDVPVALLWQSGIFHLFNWWYPCLCVTSEVHLQLSSPDAWQPLFTRWRDGEVRRGRKGQGCPILIGGVCFSQLSEHDGCAGNDGFFFGKQRDAEAGLCFQCHECWISIKQIQQENPTVVISVVADGWIDSLMELFLIWEQFGDGFGWLSVWKTGCGSGRVWKLANRWWMEII